jgi:hypothetical protein
MNLPAEATLRASITHTGPPDRSGEWTAAVFIRDDAGQEFVGDNFPITTTWQDVPLDLHEASAVDLTHVVGMGLRFTHVHGDNQPLTLQTDTWALRYDHHAYVGARLGIPQSFYVQRDGTRLMVGRVNQYEITFFERAGTTRPWMSITQTRGEAPYAHTETALGQTGTGLMLLDQNQYDALGKAVRQDAVTASTENATAPPTASWPSTDQAVHWTWACEWSSPVAAIIEGKEQVGPYDHAGIPAVTRTWRFMIYQWGQVFVHVEWAKGFASVPDPMSWALVLDRAAFQADFQTSAETKNDAGTQRLLAALYPTSVHNGLTTALPHEMQTDAPIAMLAKTGGKNNCWWASAGDKRIFGVGVGERGGDAGPLTSLDCMLLVNHPTPLMEAGTFSQYLVPAKVKTREGELDRNFPGDTDNDGLVESYGFQVIRLSHGRAAFTIYPQGRPLFYLPFLFTIPAVERDADDLKHSRMLINVEGTQFSDPPQFPDGSFLLQMPYVVDRPVQVEAVVQRE